MKITILHRRMAPKLGELLAAKLTDAECRWSTRLEDPVAPDTEILVAHKVPKGLLASLPRLRWLQLTSVGFDQLKPEPHDDALHVTNAGAVPAAAVAEFAWMAVLALFKRSLLLWNNAQMREWTIPQGIERLAGSTMVLLGVGNVGRAFARRASGFDVRLIGLTRSPRPVEGCDEVRGLEALPEVLSMANAVVCALPDAARTRRLLNAQAIARLKRGAFVVNVGRGGSVDTAALASALREGHLGGAVLDVVENEPVPHDSALWDVPNLWLTPHCAYASSHEEEDLAVLIAENYGRLKRGQPLLNEVRPWAV